MFNPIEYVRAKIREYNENIDTRPSSSMYELVIIPLAALVGSMYDEMSILSISQSVKNYDIMPEDDMDALVANHFIEREDGGRASGVVSYYFGSPKAVFIPKGAIVEASNGSTYSVDEDVTVSAGEMSLNKQGVLYFANASVTANESGEAYNVLPGEIVRSLLVIEGLVSVSNDGNISGGGERESNLQLYDRAKVAITTRNLLSDRSIYALISEDFPEITGLEIVGKGDNEMLRDVQSVLVAGLAYDMHIGGCVDIYADTENYETVSVDVEHGDYIPISKTRAEGFTGSSYALGDDGIDGFSDINANFLDSGVVGRDEPEPGDILYVFNDTVSKEYEIIEVLGATSLKVSPGFFTIASGLAYSIEKVGEFKSPVASIRDIDVLGSDTGEPNGTKLSNGVGFAVDVGTLVEDGNEVDVSSGNGTIVAMSYTFEGEIYALALAENQTVIAGPIKISDGGVNSNSSVAIKGETNLVVLWESIDGAGWPSIKMSVIDFQSEVVIVAPQIVDEAELGAVEIDMEPHSPKVVCSNQEILISYIRRVNIEAGDLSHEVWYTRYQEYPYSAQSPSVRKISSGMDGTGDSKGMDFTMGNESFEIPHAAIINIASDNSIRAVVFGGDGFGQGGVIGFGDESKENKSPSISMNDEELMAVSWVENDKDLYVSKINNDDGLTIIPESIAARSVSFMRAQDMVMDKSGKIHLAFINENDNSGDIQYLKIDDDLLELVAETSIHDQGRNSDNIAIVTCHKREPSIIWDSSDLRSSRIDGCKRVSQDFSLRSGDVNKRYSSEEILDLRVDDDMSEEDLRIHYYYPSGIENLSKFVASRDSIDRVVVASYLVKTPIPCFIDINMEYSGDDEAAVEAVTEYINKLDSPDLYISDIMSAMDLSVSSRVSMPFGINGELHHIDGSIRTIETQDGFSLSRTVRYVARNIEVV